jgi:acetyl esterase
MPLSEMAAAFLGALNANFPDVGGTCDDAEVARATLRAAPKLPMPDVELASLENRTIPGPDGEIPVRISTPLDATDPPGVITYLHGGGWVVGDLDSHDRTTQRLAAATGAVVVSVDYRLAPEHRFPAAADDAYAATVWTREHYGPSRHLVAGDSAGGNLAAVVCLMARDQGGPAIDHQLLVYPCADCAMDTESYEVNGTDYFLTRTKMAWFWEQYLGDDDGSHPYASPLRAADLTGLPPATVITAEFDPLRDEGEAYATALAAAGVPTEAFRADGLFHGFFGLDELLPEAQPGWELAVSQVRAALRP